MIGNGHLIIREGDVAVTKPQKPKLSPCNYIIVSSRVKQLHLRSHCKHVKPTREVKRSVALIASPQIAQEQ